MELMEEVVRRLDRIEMKLDRVVNDVAEMRGARKIMYSLASALGAICGAAAARLMH